MAGGSIPRATDPNDPMGPEISFKLKDGYQVEKSDDVIDFASAGLNGFGDFIIKGVGMQIIRIPDEHRVKLAAYLLSPILDTEPIFLVKASHQIQVNRQNKEIQPELRAAKPPKKGGVVARP